MRKSIRIFFLVLAITFVLMILAIGVYYYLRAHNGPIRITCRYDSPWQIKGDPDVGFLWMPFIDNDIKIGSATMRVFTDDLGNRATHKFTPNTKPDGPNQDHADIVAIGCSQTYGHGVPADKTFVSVLGKLVESSYANLGVSAYGGVTAYKKLQKFWYLNPKIVVYGYWEDHDHRNVSPCAPNAVDICLSQPYIVIEK